jgi:hypothetical protein
MTIWWMFFVLYSHQVVYVSWFPMHLQDESCQTISLPNLVGWLELEVMLTFHHHRHYKWWTLMCCGNGEHGKLWGRYNKWNHVHHLLFSKDHVTQNLHQCTNFLLANWKFINGRFFFPLFINNPKFYFKCENVRCHYLIDGNICVMKEKLNSTKLCVHYCWNLLGAKLEKPQLAPSPKLTIRLTWTHSWS